MEPKQLPNLVRTLARFWTRSSGASALEEAHSGNAGLLTEYSAVLTVHCNLINFLFFYTYNNFAHPLSDFVFFRRPNFLSDQRLLLQAKDRLPDALSPTQSSKSTALGHFKPSLFFEAFQCQQRFNKTNFEIARQSSRIPRPCKTFC